MALAGPRSFLNSFATTLDMPAISVISSLKLGIQRRRVADLIALGPELHQRERELGAVEVHGFGHLAQVVVDAGIA